MKNVLNDKKFNVSLRIGKLIGVISMPGNIDVNETRALLNFSHAWTVHKLLKRRI